MSWFTKVLNTTKPTYYFGDFNWELLYPELREGSDTVDIKQCV
jgi:hypothetical protein